MPKIAEITVSDTDLIKINPTLAKDKAKDRAKKIISDTTKVSINGKPATVKKDETSTSMTLKVPADLGVDPWMIVLAADEDDIIAVFTYDPETNEFPAPDEDEDDEIPDAETVANAAGGRRKGRKK